VIATGGAVVAFTSPSTNLAPDGGNQVADVFAKIFDELAPPPTAVLSGALATVSTPVAVVRCCPTGGRPTA
jgi:hypothetical protein